MVPRSLTVPSNNAYLILTKPANLFVALGRPDGSSATVLVQNKVSIILDRDKGLVVAGWGSGVGVPSGLAILVTATYESITVQRGEREDLGLLDAKVAITLHDGALCVADLLVGALPGTAVVVVDGELAVVLHAELDGAVFAEDAHADHEPVAVIESAVTHFE